MHFEIFLGKKVNLGKSEGEYVHRKYLIKADNEIFLWIAWMCTFIYGTDHIVSQECCISKGSLVIEEYSQE